MKAIKHGGRRFALSLTTLAMSCLAGQALAQTASEKKPPDSTTVTLDTVVISAQKRLEPQQEVPVPVTAFDAKMLEKTGATDVRDLALRTPGLTMTQFNVGEPQYSIRGVGSTSDSAGGDASVAVFVDDVFIGRPAGANFSFLDLDRVEILRGPQGTLFGRNTSGGAISVTTARPSQTASTKLFASLGNYDAVDLGAVFNRPLSETVSAKLAVGHRRHAGYSHEASTGKELDSSKSTSARLQVLMDLTPSTTLLLSADTARDRGTGNARVPYPIIPGTPIGKLLKVIYPNGVDPRVASSDPDSFQDRDVSGFSARLEHDLSFGSLTSITAYRETKLKQFEDLSGSKSPLWILKNLDRVDERAEQWSQELRLANPAGSTFSWVAGLYYFTETVRRAEGFETAFTPLPAAGGNVLFRQRTKNESAAAFGQVDLPLAKALNLSVGLRQTVDRKEAHQVALNLLPNDPTPGLPLFPGQPYDISAAKRWSALTGKLGLDYKLDRDKMIYATLSKGYKSGLFPSQNNSPASVGVPLAPENVVNTELGFKSEWLGRRLRVNASAFKFDYTDLQQMQLNPQLVLLSFNVDAKVKGAELELLAAPANWLTVGANAAYLDTKITRGLYTGLDLTGKRLMRAPRGTWGLFAEATTAISGGQLAARAEYARKSTFYTESSNSLPSLVPAYGVWDARLSYRMAGGPELALWGKNLTDTLYQSSVIVFQGNGFSTFGAPRTYGVSLSWTLK